MRFSRLFGKTLRQAPAEARDADVGIACGKRKGAIFRKGKVVGTASEQNFLEALMAEIDKI